ncbi:protein adenylyltransferase SelO [Motiliproteus sediminis]|uniref:protein adenylyltransferase SelO n=1 Tax=Motiliproteus sediminis TaxID=1468178 RepID=UPI001AEFE290
MFTSAHLYPCRYATLGQADFFAPVEPRGLNHPRLIHLNQPLADHFGLGGADFTPDNFLHYLADKRLPEGVQPLACAYSGHQFGVFNPQLGDGRAMLLGEFADPQGERWEFQLKGSGPTPYSRGFDGRAVLRSVIREYLASEAMAGLGIPTTRALCVVDSDTPVFREEVESASMMIRVAPSHLRFGSFEHFYARQEYDRLRQLADFCIEHYFPDLAERKDRYAAWFETVVVRTAKLIAQWQAVGFCHGVMNTDNFSILGLTIDYGPYGFLETYDPKHICNHSDHQGRYAFELQPRMALWNCYCLAQALTPLVDKAALQAALDRYDPVLQKHYLERMRAKLGLWQAGPTQEQIDEALVAALFQLMQAQQLDYSRFFRGLCAYVDSGDTNEWLLQQGERGPIEAWLADYRLRLEEEPDADRANKMRRENPKYVLRNYLAQQAIDAAKEGDNRLVDQLLTLLQAPFDEHPQFEPFSAAAPEWAADLCVSCSS